jgi:cation diffusion facilitator CzcD-associated flavoprotein CzcO
MSASAPGKSTSTPEPSDPENDLSWNEVPTRQKVLVVGAGPAGLAAAASLRALKVPFDLVDSAKDVGGIWDPDREDSPVWPSLEMISSTRFTQYEDLVQPVSFPSFLSPDRMAKYLRAYAARYHLTDHFLPRMGVRAATPFEDGVWQVEFHGGRVMIYRAVVAAHGTTNRPHLPEWALDVPSSVTTLHSSEWTGADGLEGKRVLVVGSGQSAADVSVDAARRALEVRWSARSGHWIVPRTIGGTPGDVAASHEPEALGALNERIAEGVIGRSVGNPARLGLPRPAAPLLEDRVIVSDDVAPRIRDGRITPVGDVRGVEEDGTVGFAGDPVYRPDVIVFATGYERGADYLPDDVVPTTTTGTPDLFLDTFPRGREDLVLLGQQHVSGGILPLLVQQADLAAYVLRATGAEAVGAAAPADGARGAAAPTDGARHAGALAEFRRLKAGSDSAVPRQKASSGLRARLDGVLGRLPRTSPSAPGHHTVSAMGGSGSDAGPGAARAPELVPYVSRDELVARLGTVRALFE